MVGVCVRNSKNPAMLPASGAEPGTCAQISWTSADGPPTNVVPVSIADMAESPVAICTLFPWTVTPMRYYIIKFRFKTACWPHIPLICKSQKLCVTSLGMSTNWMSPVNRLEFVPPNVKTPPGSSAWALVSLLNLANQNDISGELHILLLVSACQKGKDLVEASDWNARPIRPVTGVVTIEAVVCCAMTARCESTLVAK